jgi:hypothetical protein
MIMAKRPHGKISQQGMPEPESTSLATATIQDSVGAHTDLERSKCSSTRRSYLIIQLRLRFRGERPMKIDNFDGDTIEICPCGSRLNHWKKLSGAPNRRFCPVIGCIRKPEVGALVQKTNSSDQGWYITPLCTEHSAQTGGSIDVGGSTILVPANATDTCGREITPRQIQGKAIDGSSAQVDQTGHICYRNVSQVQSEAKSRFPISNRPVTARTGTEEHGSLLYC